MQARRSKALDLLTTGWPATAPAPRYCVHSALVLCRLARFRPGLLLLYDRLKLPREALQVGSTLRPLVYVHLCTSVRMMVVTFISSGLYMQVCSQVCSKP